MRFPHPDPLPLAGEGEKDVETAEGGEERTRGGEVLAEGDRQVVFPIGKPMAGAHQDRVNEIVVLGATGPQLGQRLRFNLAGHPGVDLSKILTSAGHRR